jgi:hypothetical protein
VGRFGEKCEALKGEGVVEYLRSLAREAEELHENQARHKLGEKGIMSSINTFDFKDGTNGRVNICTSSFTIDTEDFKIGPHWLP